MFWWFRAGYIFSALRRDRTDDEIDEEFRFHVEETVNENIEAGMSPDEARLAALARFGSLSRIAESSREIRRGKVVDSIAHDLRNSIRLLRKHPGFSFVVVTTIALGIGANAAIFSVVDSVLLKPLPYDRPIDLTLIWSSFQKMGATRAPASGIQLRELRTRSRLFQDVAGIWVGNGTFTGDVEPEQVKVADVTPNFFSVLGAHPALGRDFLSSTSGVGPNELIISDGLWKRRFGLDPNIIGRAVQLRGNNYTIVGVMPADFLLAFPVDANVPMNIQAFSPFQYDISSGPRDLYFIRMLGRIKPGVSIEQAQLETNSIASQMRNEYAEYHAENLQYEVAELHRDVVRDIRPALLALFVGAVLVLVIGSFNVANLLLAQASTRRKEIALRAAIGASRWRIAQQLMTESLVICLLGGLLGLGIGWAGLKLLLSIRPESLARIGDVNINLKLVGFVTGLSIVCGLIASLAPMLESAKVSLIEPLKEEGRFSSVRNRNRARSILIVSEMALGFVLLVGAGLMIRTLFQLRRVSPGFNPSNVLTFEIMPPGEGGTKRDTFVTECERRISALPGVVSVGAISHLPLDDYPNWYSPYSPEGVTESQKTNLLADYRAITTGYFSAIGAHLISGREFDKFDDAKGRKVVVVDDLLARQTWPATSAIGKKLNVEEYSDGDFANTWAEVVGVVEHIKGQSLLRTIRGQIYIPYTQSQREHLSFVVRTTVGPASLSTLIRSEIAKIDKRPAIAKMRPMEDYIRIAMAPTNFTTILASLFAALALILATVGIYAVVSFSIGQRTYEMGVRMALGARPSDILRLILGEGLLLTCIGLSIGMAASIALSGYLRSLLFNVTPLDPMTYVVMAAVIPLAALLACWRPAQKAAWGNPVEVLKD